jgi:glutamate dehydrogenase (NAD(P)+)
MHVGHSSTSVVTGKPIEMGGSLGRREATGRGAMIVAREAAKHLGFELKASRIAVQGFGNVGGIGAQLMAEQGAKIIGVTDWKGGVQNDKGLDVPKLLEWVATHKTVAGFPGGDPLGQADVFKLDVNILVPAALEKQITEDNVNDIKARLIVEGANGPTTPGAHKILHERGVFVVPDILANAGGVTTSYFEWVQDRHGYFWTEKEVNDRLEVKMCEAFKVVLETALKYTVDMRVAALPPPPSAAKSSPAASPPRAATSPPPPTRLPPTRLPPTRLPPARAASCPRRGSKRAAGYALAPSRRKRRMTWPIAAGAAPTAIAPGTAAHAGAACTW